MRPCAQQTPPIYRADNRIYLIDTCAPQRRAIEHGKIEFHALTHGHYPGVPIHKSILPALSGVGWWNAVGEQDWGLDPHRNEGVEIVFLESGGMVFTVDDRRHNLRAGDLTITRPWQLHCLGDPRIGPGKLHWLILDVGVRRPNQGWRWPEWVSLIPQDLDELTRKLRHNENAVWRSTPDIRHAFEEISFSVEQNKCWSHISRLTISINRLLLGILEALRRQNRTDDPSLTSRERTVTLFLSDLKRNPANLARRWTLDEMAAQCGMGTTSLAKYSRQLVNASPMKFLNRSRCEWAARLLRDRADKTITDIAMECGFESSQYFASQFRRHFRCAPGEYRRRDLRDESPS